MFSASLGRTSRLEFGAFVIVKGAKRVIVARACQRQSGNKLPMKTLVKFSPLRNGWPAGIAGKAATTGSICKSGLCNCAVNAMLRVRWVSIYEVY